MVRAVPAVDRPPPSAPRLPPPPPADVPGPLRRVTSRFGWAATAWRVHRRVAEVHGNQLAAAVTLSAFLALFPLLLAVIAIIGFVASERPELAGDIVSRLGLTGSAADLIRDAVATANDTKVGASLISLVGLLWSGLGLVGAMEAVFDAVWQASGRGVRGKLVGLLWLLGAIAILGGAVALTALLAFLPATLDPLTVLVSFTVSLALWLWSFRTLTNRPLPWRAHLPGAVLLAVGMHMLTVIGAVYVPRAVASASALYGPLGIVLAVLAWLLVFGRLVVYATALNVVRWEEDHGTVSVEIELPRVPGDVPVGATRAGEQIG